MKIKYTYIIFLLLIVATKTVAQDTTTIYYNELWMEISNEDEAVYYRKAFIDSNKECKVTDFYKESKQVQMTGTFKSIKQKVKNGWFNYYYENGGLSTKAYYIDNKLYGEWFSCYENGQLELKGKYKNDEKEGIWKYWDNDGNLIYEKTYKKGHILSMTAFYKNGLVQFKGNFINDKANGEWCFWNADGEVFFKGNFKKGEKNGEWTRFFPTGKTMKINYKKGVYKDNPIGGIYINE